MFNLKEFLGLGYYVSSLDEFLTDYDKNHAELSKTQKAEVTKHARVSKFRDQPTPPGVDNAFWDKF